MSSYFYRVMAVASLHVLVLSGCTTTASKKALAKPQPKDSYSGFDAKTVGENSKRKAPDPVVPKDTAEPEEAVAKLVEYLKGERAYAITAEEQLRIWGAKQGVDKIIVSKVRLLIKHPRVEVRAPALRLVMLFGDNTSNGDLIECLADSEYGMRATAFKALKARTKNEFDYDPAGGEVARGVATERWRRWWQAEQSRLALQAPTVYEGEQPREPKILRPGETDDEAAPKKKQPAPEKSNTAKKQTAPKKEKKTAPSDSDKTNEDEEVESKLFLNKGEYE
jgi:hypothetical protein